MVTGPDPIRARLLLDYPALGALFGRGQSPRLLEPHPIRSELELCALAAQSAASRRGAPPIAFTAVAGAKLDELSRLLEGAEPAVELSGAPMAILVLVGKGKRGSEGTEAALESFLLALAALGYGWRLGPTPAGEAIRSFAGVLPELDLYRLIETGTPDGFAAPAVPDADPALTML